MNSVHLVIPELFLPADIAAEASAGLSLPALENLLGRGHGVSLGPVVLEDMLCELFGVSHQEGAPIAAVSALFDGLGSGCWLRADPVHLRLQRDQMLLLAHHEISTDEAEQLCASLNQHFAGQGLEFFAPHPQRWYVRMDEPAAITTTPLSLVIGGDVRGALPGGANAARWHQLFNEIQMLLFAHPLNQAREACGALTINSVWLWGGGEVDDLSLPTNYARVSSDEVMVEMLAAAAGVPFSNWAGQWSDPDSVGRQLRVWTGLRSALQKGDLAAWRNALQEFENNFARPLWHALRSGQLAGLQLDVLGVDSVRRVSLKRRDTWVFWRHIKRLAEYSVA